MRKLRNSVPHQPVYYRAMETVVLHCVSGLVSTALSEENTRKPTLSAQTGEKVYF